jgi:hypothetical protein
MRSDCGLSAITDVVCSSCFSSAGNRSIRAARIVFTVAGICSASTNRVSKPPAPPSGSLSPPASELTPGTLAPLHQHLRERRHPGVRIEEGREQLRRALGGQAVEPELGVGGFAGPAVLELGNGNSPEAAGGPSRGSPPGCRGVNGSRHRSSAGPRRPPAAVALGLPAWPCPKTA